MKKQIITIGRQCGSGGHTIGKLVAEHLGIPFYDKRILEIVAQRSGLSEETVKEQGEYTPNSLLYMIATNISYGYNLTSKENMPLPDQIHAFQTELIKELAEKESCVIVGREADYILQDCPDCFHVFVYGNLEDRKRRVISEHRVAANEAEAHVLGRDRKRAGHYKHYTDRTWGQASNYHLCMDSSYFGIDTCVEMILKHIEDRKDQEAER